MILLLWRIHGHYVNNWKSWNHLKSVPIDSSLQKNNGITNVIAWDVAHPKQWHSRKGNNFKTEHMEALLAPCFYVLSTPPGWICLPKMFCLCITSHHSYWPKHKVLYIYPHTKLFVSCFNMSCTCSQKNWQPRISDLCLMVHKLLSKKLSIS